MTARAVARQRILEVGSPVARFAVECGVRAGKREPRCPQVIVLRPRPTGRLVAVDTCCTPRAGVDVVGRVARGALRRCAGVAVASMAGGARYLHVLSRQCVLRLRVVETHACPAGGFVAIGAIAAELAGMRILFAMAIDAGRRRLALLAARRMAVRAGHGGVRSQQRKVGPGVRERSVLQLHDIGLATFVLAVACAALGSLRAGQPAMESPVLRDVGSDRFMTGTAERRLARSIGSIVAARAFLLVLRVTRNDRARASAASRGLRRWRAGATSRVTGQRAGIASGTCGRIRPVSRGEPRPHARSRR